MSQNFLYYYFIQYFNCRDEVSRIEEESRLEMELEQQNQINKNQTIQNQMESSDPLASLSPEQREVYNSAIDGYVFLVCDFK